MSIEKTKKRKRLVEIDILTGITIVLVVLGHLASDGEVPTKIGNNIYFFLKDNIYLFHMPLFMFLSGCIFYYTYNEIETVEQYFQYIAKKAKRLLPGLLLFGSIMIFAKVILIYKGHISYSFFYDLFKNYFKLLYAPMSSFSRSLWYIYVLLEYYIVFSLLLIVLKKNKWVLIVIGLCLYIISPNSHFLAYKEFSEYFVFFSIGILFISYYEKCIICFKKYCTIFNILFILSFFIAIFINKHSAMFITGFLSIPAFYSLIYKYFHMKNNIFAKIGKYTFPIYLMNTIIIGVIEVILLKFINLNNENFTYIFPFIFVAGFLIPILLKKYLFNRIAWLDEITK